MQQINLSCAPYKENKAILIRILLDAFFAGELPNLKKRFEAEVSKKVLRESKGLSVIGEEKIEAGEKILKWIRGKTNTK